jgi:hypothetical protein
MQRAILFLVAQVIVALNLYGKDKLSLSFFVIKFNSDNSVTLPTTKLKGREK